MAKDVLPLNYTFPFYLGGTLEDTSFVPWISIFHLWMKMHYTAKSV